MLWMLWLAVFSAGVEAAGLLTGHERQASMLSINESQDGMLFILQLRNASGVACQWMEFLRGDVAKRRLHIYQTSDWEALRQESAGIFSNSVTEAQLYDVLNTDRRCICIHTLMVKVEDLRDCRVFADVQYA
jgi:hypothetical protein